MTYLSSIYNYETVPVVGLTNPKYLQMLFHRFPRKPSTSVPTATATAGTAIEAHKNLFFLSLSSPLSISSMLAI